MTQPKKVIYKGFKESFNFNFALHILYPTHKQNSHILYYVIRDTRFIDYTSLHINKS